ncbi:hypothetical protein F4678DRAFT_23236 [Xylaria arbuscula]|nr:hypothetical protein F4678DRAFT_23236 [Xylaria arbuscula]
MAFPLRGPRPCAHLTMASSGTSALSCRNSHRSATRGPEKALMRGRGPERTSAELSNRPTMSASRETYEHMPWFPGSPFGTYFSSALAVLPTQREGLSAQPLVSYLFAVTLLPHTLPASFACAYSRCIAEVIQHLPVSSTDICNGPLWLEPQLRAMRGPDTRLDSCIVIIRATCIR